MKVGGMQKADLMKACLEKGHDLLGFVNSPQPTRAACYHSWCLTVGSMSPAFLTCMTTSPEIFRVINSI